jgi:hypothetical protein
MAPNQGTTRTSGGVLPHDYNFREYRCFPLTAQVDLGGTSDFYLRAGRGDGIVKSAGALKFTDPAMSDLHGRFIDTKNRTRLWP